MKKMIFTIAAFSFMLTGMAQNEKPTTTESDPDSLTQKANYNTTRTSKTVKGPSGEGAKEEKKEEKVKAGKGGGKQAADKPFILFQDKKRIQRDLK
jgi:Ni/Co efflux regulator RcnB